MQKNLKINTKIVTFRLSKDDNFVCQEALEPFLQIKTKEFVIHVLNVNVKQHWKDTEGIVQGQFMKTSVIIVRR